MRVVFFGTPEFAVPALEALQAASGMEIGAVITQPDRPRTRSHSTLLPSPVKQVALRAGLPIWQPERPRGDLFLAACRELEADLGVVVAYGHILRPDLLAIPRLGMVNVHASLLPRWRGAAPIHWAVLAGDPVTGVSIMQMDAGLDSGPVWHTRSLPITDSDTTGSLLPRLATLGAEALIEALPKVAAGATAAPQSPSLVTVAPKVDRAVARIDWNASACEVSCRIRAMDPSPGAWTTFAGEPVKLARPTVVSEAERSRMPGEIEVVGNTLRVACGEGTVAVATIQPAGRRQMAADDWWCGHAAAAPRFA